MNFKWNIQAYSEHQEKNGLSLGDRSNYSEFFFNNIYELVKELFLFDTYLKLKKILRKFDDV